MIKIARIKTHILEKVIGGIMVIFAVAAVYIFIKSLSAGLMLKDIATLELLLILVLAILAQTVVLLRIYEQHL
ncbi:hypothetical protein JW930_05125 [Candidatus Woesearchaeota archaeon]|nr:hypothetical protein [Candidatus Woesearchaeota archaeon]